MWHSTMPYCNGLCYTKNTMNDANSASDVISAGPMARQSMGVPVFARDEPAKILNHEEITAADIAGNNIEPALTYWNDLRGDRLAPARRDVKLDELPPKLIPAIAIIEFVDDPIDYLYRFFGSSLVQVSGMELTGKRYFADKIKGYGFVNEKLLPEIIQRKEPLFHSVEWQSVRGIIYKTTSLRLPLSDDNETVSGVMSANSWAHVK